MRRRRPRHSGGFHTVSLNLYGWMAMIGAGVVLGVIVALVTPTPWPIALAAGVAIVWGTLLVLDHIRFSNSMTQLGDDRLDPTIGAALVARLLEMGIAASYVEDPIDEEDGGGIQRSIMCQRRDADAVSRLMAEELN